MQYENEPLLKQLAILSSISGGTITGVVYAHTLAEGGSFDDFYHKMYGFLKKDTLLTSALSKLNNPDAWKDRPLKQRNLINAFALVYDEELFHGATLGSLLAARGRLPEFAFNATDVEHSKVFRFAVSQFAVIGLGDVFLSRIRDMNYKSLFGDSYWRERVLTNYIYQLLGKPSNASEAIEQANQMGTTLWFSAEQKRPGTHMLDALIEAGRATMEHQLREKMAGVIQEPDLISP